MTKKQKQDLNKVLMIDIETDFNKKLLSVGFLSYDNKIEEEYFIFQKEEYLSYPDNDTTYKKCLVKWRESKKTPIRKVLERLVDLSEKYILFGWNIQNFDLSILSNYCKKYEIIGFKPLFIDGYLDLKDFFKQSKRRVKPAKLSVDFLFKHLTGTDLCENHEALSDCKVERYLFKELKRRYGSKLYPISESASKFL